MDIENHFKTLAVSAPIGIFQADRLGQCIYVNPAICRFTGLSEKEHLGSNWSSAVHPNDRDRVYAAWQETIVGKSHFETEFRFKNRDEITWVSSHSAAIMDDSGEITGFIGTLTETTHQRQGLQRSKQLNRLNEKLLGLESLNDKLKEVTQAIVDIFNVDFVRIWMIKPGDLCEKGCIHNEAELEEHRCVHKDKCLHLLASSGRYEHIDGGHGRVPFGCYKIGQIASGTRSKLLTNNVGSDPRIHHHEWAKKLGLASFAGYRLVSAKGYVVGILALFSKNIITIHEDFQLESIAVTIGQIIEMEKAKEALLKSEIKYRMMMESMVDPVYICSSDKKIVYMNSAMIERIGRDATGETCYKALHKMDTPCEWCVFDSITPGRTIESTIVSPLDNRTYRIANMPIQHEDGTISKMAIYKDITDYIRAVEEKKDAQRQLQRVRRLESIGTLAGGIAHDFNNILYPVIGFAQMAVSDLDDDHPIQENLEDILQGAKRARDLVKQILSFSNQRDLDKKTLLFTPVIEETLRLIRSTIPSNIIIKQDLDGDDLFIVANETEIHEVVMNLCTNAYHAMEETGGTLYVSLKKEQPDAELNLKPGEYCCLKVSDTGTGIPSVVMDKIFDPYFTTKAPGKGSGLGLSVIHGIVKNYSGIINVQSKSPDGTQVKVYLPVTTQTVTGNDEASGEYQTGTERILFVDDEESIVRLCTRLLERLGYQVTARKSSLEALELFKKETTHFDLIITDMAMPGLLGTQLAKNILSIRPDIPILICTGFSEQIDKDKAESIGIKGFIHKPILMTELSQKVRQLLD